ncbi:MAG: hypothetical protein QOJ15_10361 [Bradyrhizobium sp.]|jgi:hypothetical protein|nr:hypothetical protein [Bradyrhizobium sp.]
MRRLLFTAAVLLSGCQVCLAQVSTMGTTAMGLSSTPGTMLSSPLSGPSPFSALTQPGVPDTTLAPVPLASDPTTPGTAVTCSTPSGQIAPGTPTVPVTSMSSTGGTTGTTSSVLPAPTSTISAGSSTSTTAPILASSAQPATSFMSTIPGSTVPAPTPAISTPSAPSIAATPVPTSSTVPGSVSTSLSSSTATIAPAAPLGTIATSIIGSTTGTISPVSVLGSASTTVCSSTPGGPPTNGAALPLSTPQIPASPAPGTIQPAITQLGATSIDPTMIVMPTPNTSACAESVTMNLATPGMMAPANATGAAATPGVSSPSGC